MADLVRTTERHLYGGDRTEMNRLAAQLVDTGVEAAFDFDLKSIAEGAYLSIDNEMLYVWTADQIAKTATLQRGMLGSAAETHAAGTPVLVNPVFSTWDIFCALNDEFSAMSADGLFVARQFQLTSTVERTYNIPDTIATLGNTARILEVRWDDFSADNEWPRITSRDYELIRVASTAEFSSGMALRIDNNPPPGRIIKVTYADQFYSVGALNADVDQSPYGLGIDPTMLDIPPLGAAAKLLFTHEAKRTFSEIVDAGRRDVPAGAAARAGAILQQRRDMRVAQELRRQSQRWPNRV